MLTSYRKVFQKDRRRTKYPAMKKESQAALGLMN